jgi:hypothetical protein
LPKKKIEHMADDEFKSFADNSEFLFRCYQITEAVDRINVLNSLSMCRSEEIPKIVKKTMRLLPPLAGRSSGRECSTVAQTLVMAFDAFQDKPEKLKEILKGIKLLKLSKLFNEPEQNYLIALSIHNCILGSINKLGLANQSRAYEREKWKDQYQSYFRELINEQEGEYGIISPDKAPGNELLLKFISNI